MPKKKDWASVRVVSCPVCGRSTTNKKYCSQGCAKKAQRKTTRPDKEQLEKLVWTYPTTYLAKILGVTDAAIGKWCKQHGIKKPPRGYWTKKERREELKSRLS